MGMQRMIRMRRMDMIISHFLTIFFLRKSSFRASIVVLRKQRCKSPMSSMMIIRFPAVTRSLSTHMISFRSK